MRDEEEPGGGRTMPRREPPGPRLGVVWAPRAPTGLALPRIYSPSRENPRHPSINPRKVLANPSSGDRSLCFGTLPEWEIITGGLFITISASEMMRE